MKLTSFPARTLQARATGLFGIKALEPSKLLNRTGVDLLVFWGYNRGILRNKHTMNYFLLPCELLGAALEAVLRKASDFFANKLEWM